jgi:hypothetical protein
MPLNFASILNADSIHGPNCRFLSSPVTGSRFEIIGGARLYLTV